VNTTVEGVRFQLLRRLPGRLVFYTLAKGFHTFRIVGDGPTHWIFVPRELLRSADRSSLESLVTDPDLTVSLCAASDSKRICVLQMGAREVGAGFPN